MKVCMHRLLERRPWVGVDVLLYIVLPQGQCWVSVLIGFRQERRDCRLQTEEIAPNSHMDGL